MDSNETQNTVDDLTFSVKNMGSIKQGELVQKPLTVFCGPNNTGKTWVMYALKMFYDAMKFTSEQMESLPLESRAKSAAEMNDMISRNLYSYFNVPESIFSATKFNCNISEQQWQDWMKDGHNPYVFLMPAERNGLHLFYRELSSRRTALLHHASKDNININDLLRDVMKSRYAQPIADYINWLNNLTEQSKKGSDFHDEALLLQKKLVQGRYKLNRLTGDVTYKPYQKKRSIATNDLGLHTASSVVKSLFGLWFYLEYLAKKGDILMIDEPESNIHPENQLKIAHLLARLVNAGIRVVISTHSDYIVREFNNLVLLSEDKNNQLKKKHHYQEKEILKPEQVGIYLFDNNTITPPAFKPGEGFAVGTFDTVIKAQNYINDDIYHGLKEYEN